MIKQYNQEDFESDNIEINNKQLNNAPKFFYELV